MSRMVFADKTLFTYGMADEGYLSPQVGLSFGSVRNMESQ